MTRYNIAMVLRDRGRLPEAVDHLRVTVALDEATQHPDLDSDRAILAELEARLHDTEET